MPANLQSIFGGARIAQVFANSTKAYKIYKKHLKTQILNATGKGSVKLLSSSYANARFNLEKLVWEWIIVAELKDSELVQQLVFL